MKYQEKIWLDNYLSSLEFNFIDVMLMTTFVCITLKMTRSCFMTILTPGIYDSRWKGEFEEK